MTTIQQVLFELEGPYLGHPYYVTGHALYSAIARQVERDAIRRRLQVSHGVFVPGEYGTYPPAHSHAGYAGKLGSGLPPVEAYADLFLLRDPAQRWLQAGRPRDAHNAHPVQDYGGRAAFAAKCWFGRPEHVRNHRRSVQWYVHAYLHDGGAGDVVPLATDVLDGLQVGGARNYGFGALSVVDTQTVALEELDYSGLTETVADGYQLELLTPYVLTTAYPGADDQTVPWWWDVPDETAARAGGDDELRRRTTRLACGGDTYDLTTVDHGQVVGYAGDTPIETAINGVLRIGSHAKYGFGEFRIRPANADRVPERSEAVRERDRDRERARAREHEREHERDGEYEHRREHDQEGAA